MAGVHHVVMALVYVLTGGTASLPGSGEMENSGARVFEAEEARAGACGTDSSGRLGMEANC